MARNVFPTTFIGWYKLFFLMRQKHIDDGVSSILTAFFTQQGISMATDKTAAEDAKELDEFFEKKSKDAEKLYGQLILKVDKVFDDHKMMVQNIKQFYRKSLVDMGDWDVTLNGKKIVYPTNRDDLSATMKLFVEHHNSYPVGTSPITATFLTNNNIDLVANLATIISIPTLDAAWDKAAKAAETYRQNRDVKMAKVIEDTRGGGNYIVKQFPKTPKDAGDWGFVIDDSPQDAKLTTLKVKEGGEKILYTVVAGSIIQVTGSAPLTITKGKAGTGTPIVLNPGDHWQVAKGYTTMKVTNSSLTVKSALQYMSN